MAVTQKRVTAIVICIIHSNISFCGLSAFYVPEEMRRKSGNKQMSNRVEIREMVRNRVPEIRKNN